MLCKEGLRKIDQIRNDTVIGIRPEGRKLKAVAGLALFRISGSRIFYRIASGAVGMFVPFEITNICTYSNRPLPAQKESL